MVINSELSADFIEVALAHRGLHDRKRGIIENSPSAIKAALKSGYGAEIDVQLSYDGVAVVFHDDNLDRLTHESGPVNGYKVHDLQKIHLKESADYIPTLQEVLEITSNQAPLLIELKDQSKCLGESDGRLEQAVTSVLKSYGGPIAVMSFNPWMVVNLSKLAPEIARGLTTSSYYPHNWPEISAARLDELREIPDYNDVRACFISHEANDLDRPRVAELKSQGGKILCWTIRSLTDENIAYKIADNITFEGYLSPKKLSFRSPLTLDRQ